MYRFRSLPIALMMALPLCGQTQNSTDFDFTRLGHPSVAEQLELSDPQRADVARLLTARATALATARDDQRQEVVANINRELAALLSDEQRQKLQQLSELVDLQFNFDGQKWSDVLQWVAEQADMTLVFDELPEQQFSYRDNRSYSVGQAIDLLNGILISKGFTLIRRGKLLIVADISQQLPADLLPQIELEDLPNYGQFEFVKILFPLGGRPADAVEKEVSSVIGPFGNVAALPQTNQLLITETAGKMRAISALIASIPQPKKTPPATPKPPKPSLVVHPIKDIDPDAALETLRQLVPEAKLTVDRAASTINAFAVPAEQDAIEGILQQLIAGSTPELRPRLESYALPERAPAELVAQLGHIAPHSQITIDEANQRLLVFASPAEQDVIARTLAALDGTAAADRKKHVAVYKLRHAQAATTAESLQPIAPAAVIAPIPNANTIIVRGSLADQTSVSALIEKIDVEPDDEDATSLQLYPVETQQQASIVTVLNQLVPEATVSWDEVNRRLVVIATADQQQQASRIISQLAAETRIPAKRTLRVYSFAPHLKPRVSALISNMSPEQPALQIIDDTQQGELAILASEDQHSRLSELVAQLKQADQGRERLELQAYPIRNAAPDSLSSLMSELFPQTRVVVDADARRLLVWATQETHTSVRQAIQQLDVETTARELEKLVTYDAPGLELTNVLSLLTAQYPNMVLNADSESGKILAWGNAKDHERLASTLAELRQANPPRETSIRVYPTAPRAPDQLIPLIADSVPGATLTPDVETGTILVRATAEEHRLLKAALEQLPLAESAGRQRTLVAYPVKPADAANAVSVLSKIIPQATLSTASDNSQLFVWATTTEHDRVRATLETMSLDKDSKTERNFRIYQVRPRTADTVSTVLAEVAPDARITSQTANQITVWAQPADQQRIATVLEQFSAAHEQTDAAHEFKVYRVPPQNTNTVSTILAEVAPGARITNQTASEITVWAQPDDHQQIAALLDQLAGEILGKSTQRGNIRVYPLQDATGSDLMELLSGELSPEVETAVSSDGDRLIVRATAEEHEKLARIIPDLIRQLGEDEKPVNRVYRPQVVTTETLVDVFDDLYPGLQTAADDDGRLVAVTALPSVHENLQTMFDQLEQGQADRPLPKTYRLTKADAGAVHAALTFLLRRNRNTAISVEPESNAILVVAPSKEQQLVARIIEEFNIDASADETPQTTEIYALSEVSTSTISQLLESQLSKDAVVTSDSTSNMVIVRAAAADHVKARATLDRLAEQLPAADTRTSQVYHLQTADPDVVADIFGDLAPRARVAIDQGSRTVAVTASAAEHKRLAEVLAQLETGPSQVPIPKTYAIDKSDPSVVYSALLELYDGTADVTVTWHPGSDSILVMASPRNHETIGMVVEEFAKPGGIRRDDTLQVYSLRDINGESAQAALDSLLADENPPPRVELDAANNQLLVIGTPPQHETIRSALERMKRQRRDIEFFQLQANDALTLELAIDELFKDLPDSASPSVEANIETQQLIVRATDEQMQRIRDLLGKMGEDVVDPNQVDDRRLRVIPFHGNVRDTMGRLQDLWPQLHRNELQVIYPADFDDGSMLKRLPSNDSLENNINPRGKRQRDELPQPARTPVPQAESDTTAAGETTETVPTEQLAPPRTDNASQQPARLPVRPPPVVVIPGPGRLTITSEDPAALNEFEALLRVFSSPYRAPTSDVAIFGLRNAGATETSQLLKAFFKEIPSWGRLGQVIVVPDSRLNALVVHGSRAGRDVVREILTVLDSGEGAAQAAWNTPRIVPVKRASAARILRVLTTVYETQLSSGGGRRQQIDIPEGVDKDVADVLEQINAAASGPLLTLEADEVTNSIIVLGPPQLAEEVTNLIGQLDAGAADAATRGIRVISLKNIRSELLQEVLEEFQPTE